MVDRRRFIGASLAACAAPLLPSADQRKAPWIDGLSFLPGKASDLKESGLDAFILDCSAGELAKGPDGEQRYTRTYDACLKSITKTRRRLRKLDAATLATSGEDLARARRRGKIAVYLQFQGCDFVEKDIDRITVFHELGLRFLQITHHFDNGIGGGCLEKETSGLKARGHRAVARMNALGIVPDVSHASDQTALDVCKASKAPVILSHGAARALVDNARCAPDEVIRAVAETGGVVGVFMMSFWLTTADVPTVDHLVAQLRHIKDVGGIDAVGIANDYPVSGQPSLRGLGNDNAKGVKSYHPWWKQQQARGIRGFAKLPKHVVIPELNHPRRMFTIHDTLAKARFSPDEIEKIMGGNWKRVIETLPG